MPVLRNHRADFAVTCLPGRGYAGTLVLHSEAGEEYGQASFVVPAAGATTVSVPLTAAGVTALRAGTVLRVDVVRAGHDPPPANPFIWPSGYRVHATRMRQPAAADRARLVLRGGRRGGGWVSFTLGEPNGLLEPLVVPALGWDHNLVPHTFCFHAERGPFNGVRHE